MRIDLNNKLDKIKCYSFSKQDLVILLSVYNAAFLLLTSIVKGHPAVCFVTAVLLSLISLFAIVWIDLIKMTNEEVAKLEHEQELIRKKLRDEYLKIHKMRRRDELLMKAGCMQKEQSEKNIVVDHDATPFSLNKDFEKVKEVHFNYIDDVTHGEKIRGKPEGT